MNSEQLNIPFLVGFHVRRVLTLNMHETMTVSFYCEITEYQRFFFSRRGSSGLMYKALPSSFCFVISLGFISRRTRSCRCSRSSRILVPRHSSTGVGERQIWWLTVDRNSPNHSVWPISSIAQTIFEKRHRKPRISRGCSLGVWLCAETNVRSGPSCWRWKMLRFHERSRGGYVEQTGMYHRQK